MIHFCSVMTQNRTNNRNIQLFEFDNQLVMFINGLVNWLKRNLYSVNRILGQA